MPTTRAILVGHLVVTGPVLALIAVGGLLGRAFMGSFRLGLLVGVIPAWLWWLLAVPRWRAWALAHGADSAQLQRLGVMTGLLWAKPSPFEKTEPPPRDRH